MPDATVCDVPSACLFRALLFKEALEEIVRSKRQHYEAWRRRRLQDRWLKRKFWQLLAWLALPAAMFK